MECLVSIVLFIFIAAKIVNIFFNRNIKDRKIIASYFLYIL